MRFFSLVLGLTLFSSVTFGATAELNVVPTSGTAPLPVTVSWSSTDVNNCQKDGVPVPLSGTEQKTVTVDTTYTLVCTYGNDYADLTWIPPTENTDGSPIPETGPGSLVGYEIKYSTTPNVTTDGQTIRIGTGNAYRVTGLTGAYYYFTIRAINLEEAFSDYSNVAEKTVDASSITANAFVDIVTPPPPPVERPVYRVVQKTNGFVLVNVGSVDTKVACDTTQTANGYSAVPTSAVKWSGSVRPIVVVSCPVAAVGGIGTGTGPLVTSASPVYRVVQKTNGFVLVIVGSVPLNTPCDRTQTVNDHYAVPTSAVTWSGSVRPIVVVAKCTAQ